MALEETLAACLSHCPPQCPTSACRTFQETACDPARAVVAVEAVVAVGADKAVRSVVAAKAVEAVLPPLCLPPASICLVAQHAKQRLRL